MIDRARLDAVIQRAPEVLLIGLQGLHETAAPGPGELGLSQLGQIQEPCQVPVAQVSLFAGAAEFVGCVSANGFPAAGSAGCCLGP